MKSARATLAIFLLVGSLISGCSSPDGGTPANGDVSPTLASFAKCDFRYLDNSTVPCEDQTVRLEPRRSIPSNWVCVWNLPGSPELAIYRDPVGPGFGLHYAIETPSSPLVGALRLETDSRTLFYSWDGGQPEDFVQFPDSLGMRANMFSLIAYSTYRTNTSTLMDADHSIRWSYYGDSNFADRFWPIHSFAVADETYYFQKVQESFVIQDKYFATGFEVTGSDFDLQVDYGKFVLGSSGEFLTAAPDPNCE